MLAQIHREQMNISYSTNHMIYDLIEERTKCNNKLFDRNIQFQIDRWGRINTTFSIMKKYINLSMISHFDNSNPIEHYFDSVEIVEHRIKIFDNLNSTIIKIIWELFDRYKQNRIDCVTKICEQLIDWYNGEDTNILTNIQIIAYIMFINTLELFHIRILEQLISLKNKVGENPDAIFILGEYFSLDVESFDIMFNHTNCDLREFFKNEYCSHSIVCVITDMISVYDPEGITDLIEESIKRLGKTIEHRREYLQIKQKYPIQSMTDDTYCIFHCVEFILQTSKIDWTKQSIDKWIILSDQSNKKITFNLVVDRIHNLIMQKTENILL